jgi:hypothetical protein
MDRWENFKRVGERLDWRDGTLTYLGIVYGSARDHEGVARLVDLVHRTLRIDSEMLSENGADEAPEGYYKAI